MKITNLKQKGFTLVELLAVILVFAIVGSIGTAILVTSLRTTSKTNVLTNVKQNGNFALTQMTKALRDATNVTNCTVAAYPTPLPTIIPTLSSISFTASNGTTVTFSCDSTNNTILYNGQPFLDTNAVQTTSCGFTCSQTSYSDYPVIGISFSLVSVAKSGVVEQQASANPVPFFTSITLRNKNR